MGVFDCPDSSSSPTPHTCVICGAQRPMEDLTAGRHLYGKQAFACNSHFFDSDRLYRGWAAFAASKHKETYEPAVPAENETHHAQTVLR